MKGFSSNVVFELNLNLLRESVITNLHCVQ